MDNFLVIQRYLNTHSKLISLTESKDWSAMSSDKNKLGQVLISLRY